MARGDAAPGDSVWQASQWTAPTSPLAVHDAASIIGATSGAANGLDGSGVGIALIDTGVVPVPGLPASQIVNGPDLSFESQGPSVRYLDTYGHGTHMAGIIVYNDPGSGLVGIAPKATVTSTKVGGADGAVDVSQMLAAINWAVQHRNDDPAHPIRVISLSYGTDTNQTTSSDPLAYAAEQAWKAGIVVVVAGGNLGGNNAKLFMPAADPYVLAVGSNAVNGTASTGDDTLSTFSTISSSRTIDITAPGESILSLRNPGSYVDTTYPSAEVGTDLFKGSGTS